MSVYSKRASEASFGRICIFVSVSSRLCCRHCGSVATTSIFLFTRYLTGYVIG